jgi:pyruvate kinase
MLSAESAAGKHPVEAVAMMNRIIEEVEADPLYRQRVDAALSDAAPGQVDVAEAVCCATRRAVTLLQAAAIVCCTSSGHTSLRAARERPEAPVLSLTPELGTAHRPGPWSDFTARRVVAAEDGCWQSPSAAGSSPRGRACVPWNCQSRV